MRRQRRRSDVYGAALVLLLATVGSDSLGFGRERPRFLWGTGTPRYQMIPGGNVREALAQAAAGANVPLWQGGFDYQGQTYPYVMAGADPATGSQTSVIPVVIIPIKFVFESDGTGLSAGDPVCGGTQSAVSLSLNSPLFQNYPFAPGGTDVGTTQYVDAFQRANFWSEVATVAPDYHVLFSASVEPTQTVHVPVLFGSTMAGPCARIGLVSRIFFDLFARLLIARLQIPATSVPVFLDYNTFFTDAGQCCTLGYHSATLSNHSYAVASYSDPGIFNVPIEDIHSLSHELGEWLDNPFLVNQTPGWEGGQATQCTSALEVGDPVTGIAFEASLNGTTYHPEDLVFVPWFARQSSSGAVNGWYTFLNTYTSPPAVCQ